MQLSSIPRETSVRNPMQAILNPRSIAIVGATPDQSKPGGRFVQFLRKFGFDGSIYAINPKYSLEDGVRYYPDLRSIGENIDLIALLVPAASVPAYLREAKELGIGGAIICSAGFSEAGEEGALLEAEIREIAKDGSLAVLGPNCVGMANIDRNLVASFSNAFETAAEFRPGHIAFISQSGAMGAAVFRLAQAQYIGVSKFFSTGNETVLGLEGLIEHLADDPTVSVILAYIEGIRDGARFMKAANKLRAAGKRLVVLKVGRSDAGKRAAQSHTGALVGGSEISAAVFRRAGAIEVSDVSELLSVAASLPCKFPITGGRVGIVSSSGGASVIATDLCEINGLDIHTFTEDTIAKLAAILPSYVGFSNPVDYGPVYGDPNAIEASLHAAAADPNVDVVVFFLALSPAMVDKIVPRLARVQEQSRKPVVAVWMAPPEGAIQSLRKHGLIASDDLTQAMRLVSLLVEGAQVDNSAYDGNSARAVATRSVLNALRSSGRKLLSERETKDVLRPYNLPLTNDICVSSEEEAEAAIARLATPSVIKADHPDLLHKSDAGAVRLNVSKESAAEAYRAVVGGASRALGTEVKAAIVQSMANRGLEMLLGVQVDPQFGPAITVGLGGVFTEVLADAVTELAPVDHAMAHSMLDRLAGAKLLDAFRGTPARDRAALVETIVSFSQFAADAGSLIEELDLNPVIVHAKGEGCVIVDAAAVLAK